MKKYVRDMINDLMRKRGKDYLPPVPKTSKVLPTVTLDSPPESPLPGDLNNQELSPDPKQRVKQLDFQAHRNEERETIG
jgi:hypothetical protein